MTENKTPEAVKEPPKKTAPEGRPPVKRVEEPAPFVRGGVWTDGEQVHVTKDPDKPAPRAPRRVKKPGGIVEAEG